MKVAQVIVTYSGERSGAYGGPINQEAVKSNMQNHLSTFNQVDSGVDNLDLIIVNNYNPKDNDYKDWIENLNNTLTKSGKIISYTRENIGLSFGGYISAIQKYYNDYDYWCFTEDDVIITQDNIFKHTISQIQNGDSIYDESFFICYSPIAFQHSTPHCGGGFGFTNKKSLHEVDFPSSLYDFPSASTHRINQAEINFSGGFKTLVHLENYSPFASNWEINTGQKVWKTKYEKGGDSWKKYVNDKLQTFYKIGNK